MSNQSQSTAGAGDQLFQNMDEQERIFAPQQVPGAIPDPDEIDVGGTAGDNTAIASRERAADGDANDDSHRVVPVRPDASINQPFVAPVDLDDSRDDDRTSGV
jgi:hypothetical protein